MPEYTTTEGFKKLYLTTDAVIASGQAVSGVIDLEQLNIVGFLYPTSWTAADITFQVSPDGVTYGDLLSDAGVEVKKPVTAGKFIGVSLPELSGARYLKVRSGTSGTPVNQAAERTISIVLTANPEAAAGAAATIADGANAVEGAIADAAASAGGTGTLSAKLRKISADIATLLTQTDGIEANLSSLDAKTPASPATAGNQTTANTALGAPADAEATGDGSIIALLKRIRTILTETIIVNGSFTRPADTTAYAAGDVASDSTSAPTVITFTNVASQNNGGGVIVSAELIDSANQATKGIFELWLFDTTVTPDNDNAVFTPTDAELATLVGVIPFDVSYVGDVTAGADGNAIYQAQHLNLPFKAGASSRNLFGVLVVRNAYTPVSAESFVIRLAVAQE